jgi:hypothetical protein
VEDPGMTSNGKSENGLLVLCSAYRSLATDSLWPGRITPRGQRILCDLRDTIAVALEVEPSEVQDFLEEILKKKGYT